MAGARTRRAADFKIRGRALIPNVAARDEIPVKPFKNVTFLLIVAPLEMLPCSAEEHAREPPRSEIP